MILSGPDIRKSLSDGSLIIDPLPQEDQIDTTSIDLRIGEPLWAWNSELIRSGKKGMRIDLDHFDFKELTEWYLTEIPKEDSGTYVIEPQTVYLASTFEKVELPLDSRLAARVEGKRGGLVAHATALQEAQIGIG